MYVMPPYAELDQLTRAIEANTASLADYHRYEELLRQSGLDHSYIFSYLHDAGFDTWEAFYRARQDKERQQRVESAVVGGLVGIGMGVLLYNALKEA